MTLEERVDKLHDIVKDSRNDIKWLKNGYWVLLAAVLASHFVDPVGHWGLLQWP